MDDYALAVDVGGTFTDIVLLNLATGDFRLLKTPSTPDDPSRGFITGISRILNESGVTYSQVRRLFHGTTIATNAILEGKGTPVGVLVSEGFKYVLEIGRHSMARLANPHVWVKPERPVPPERILEIPERTAFDGGIINALDEDAVRMAAALAVAMTSRWGRMQMPVATRRRSVAWAAMAAPMKGSGRCAKDSGTLPSGVRL